MLTMNLYKHKQQGKQNIILNCYVYCICTRIEAEIEEARLKEREALMQEVQAMKQQAQQELENEKTTYNQKLSSLECELVRYTKWPQTQELKILLQEQYEAKSKESAETSKVASSKIAELEEKNKVSIYLVVYRMHALIFIKTLAEVDAKGNLNSTK